MKAEKFEDLEIWKRGRVLNKTIYSLFGGIKDYNFRDQIVKASISVTNNIAEGFERKSNAEFKHFLFIAKGSAGEIRSMAYLGLDLKYIVEDVQKKLLDECEILSKMISALIKKL
jgi:four helix bundle protein